MRMRLLGGFRLERRGAPVTLTSQRMQALLAYLALNRTESQPRQRLAFLLWPDSSESQAHTNLRTLLHRLHSAFPEVDQLILTDGQEIAWQHTAPLSLDVDDFEQAVLQANPTESTEDDSAVCTALEWAVTCYTGDLLPDCYDEWIQPARERLRQMLFTTLERLVSLLEQRRRYMEAIVYARKLVSLDILNEASSQLLIHLHTLNGDRASALRVYHACSSALQSELGAAPGSALSAMYERLLAVEVLSPDVALPTQASAIPLIGRDHEWRRMLASWHVAASGQPRLMILAGEAGIGKTRLAEDLVTWAKRQGIITAVARCYAAEGDLAYAPVTAWLRSDSIQPEIAQLNSTWLAEIGRLAPDLVAARPDVQLAGLLSESWQRQRLFEALAQAILASHRSRLLLIDDLQWCDHDTLEWLHFLLRYEPGARLLVVGTIRAEEVTADHALIPLLETLRRESRLTEIALNPLSREETKALAEYMTGHPLSNESVDFLYDETEGNALFAVEMIRAELRTFDRDHQPEGVRSSSSSPFAQASGLPPSVQSVVTRRLSHLSPAARAILEIAAVIGRSFTFGVVTRVVDLDENAIVHGLDELWQRRIVREHGTDAYDFTHGKLRTVAYGELSAARQRILHRRVAEALEGEYAGDLDAISGQIAAHYERGGSPSQAITYYQRAAAFARQLYANDLAIAHYRHALTLLGDQPQSEIAALNEQLGDVLHFVARYDDARDVWQQALDATPELERVARAHLYRKLGNAWRDQYQYEVAQRVYNAAEDALGNPEADDDEAVWFCWGQIKLERMNVLYWLGRVTEMLPLIEQLRVLFEQHGSIIQQARLHHINMVALLRSTRYSTSTKVVEHGRANLKLLEAAGEVGALPAARFQLGFSMLWASDDLFAAEQEISIALALAEQSGDLSLEGRCLTYLTVIARMRGLIEETRVYAERSLRVAEVGRMYDYIGAAHGTLAWLAWRAGDLAAAHFQEKQALEAWNRLPVPYMFEWIGRLPRIATSLAEGDVTEALVHARVLLDEGQKRLPLSVEVALESAVRAATDLVESHKSLQQAIESAQKLGYL